MTKDKWYNSFLADGIGLTFLCFGIGSCCHLVQYHSQEPPQIQEVKVDKHNLRYYNLDKKIAVIDVDKEPILEFLKRH